MNPHYAALLAQIKEEPREELHKNSRILLIDGMNTFIRAFCVNTYVNDNGVPIGGIVGFLYSIGYAIKTFNPTRCIILFDGEGGSKRRKEIYPEYKGNRSQAARITKHPIFVDRINERAAMQFQMKRIALYLQKLPVQYYIANDIEADDAIGYLATNTFKNSEVIIMSSDQDFYQLINDKISVWSPTKKKIYNEQSFFEEFNYAPQNHGVVKCFMGDKSDNIPGVHGVGLKTLLKNFKEFNDKSKRIQISDILIKSKNEENNFYKKILANEAVLYKNYSLVKLSDEYIPREKRIIIDNYILQPINQLHKLDIMKLMIEDGVVFKNPDIWINQTFNKLSLFARNE